VKSIPCAISGFITALLLPTAAAMAFCFEEAGSAFNLNPRLLKSIAFLESGMNPIAVHNNKNGSVDLGLMQVNSSWITAANLDKERLMRDACYNTQTGARILRDCIDRLGYTWEAIGCYNAAGSDNRKNYAWKVYRQLVLDGKTKPEAIVSAPKSFRNGIDRGKRDNVSLTFSIDSQESGENRLP
jgi:hypothetical protein